MTTDTKVTPAELFSHFKMMTNQYYPYLSTYVYSMVPVERPGIGTMAMDMYGRCYYDPAFCETLTLEQGAYVVLHEAMHLILRHCHRAKKILGATPTKRERVKYNIAVDLVVWEMLEAIEHNAPGDCVTYPKMKAKYPKLEKNMTVEEIYSIIMEKQPGGGGGGDKKREDDDPEIEETEDDEKEPGEDEGDQEDGEREPDDSEESGDPEDGEESEDEDGGDDSRDQGSDEDSGEDGDGEGEGDPEGEGDEDGEFKPVGGGSGADGIERDYEEEPNDNWDAFQEDQLLETVEKAIEEEEGRGCGTIPGLLKTTIRQKLRPQPNPWDLLRATLARAIASVTGAKQGTYRKRNRRQSMMPADTLLQGHTRHQPSAVCVIDTSGSMTSGCLAKALVVVKQGLTAIGKLPVITCDARVTGNKVLTSVNDEFVLVGGGGTDMRIPIAHAEREYAPDVIVLVTDGYTPWPDLPTTGQLIVACTTDCQGIPKWAKTVRIPDSPNKEEL